MLPLFRLLFILLIVLTIIYVGVSIYSRQARRAKLAARWDAKGMLTVDRETFIKRGLKKYDKSIRRKLILGIYIVPLSAIAVLVYVTNFM